MSLCFINMSRLVFFCSICQCILDILPARLTLIPQAVDPQAHACGGLHQAAILDSLPHTVTHLSDSDRSCKVSVYVGSAPARREGCRGYGFRSQILIYLPQNHKFDGLCALVGALWLVLHPRVRNASVLHCCS